MITTINVESVHAICLDVDAGTVSLIDYMDEGSSKIVIQFRTERKSRCISAYLSMVRRYSTGLTSEEDKEKVEIYRTQAAELIR